MTDVIKAVYLKPLKTKYVVSGCEPQAVSVTGAKHSRLVVVDEIRRISRSGEMSAVPWLEIIWGMGVACLEVRLSDCVVYSERRGEKGPF